MLYIMHKIALTLLLKEVHYLFVILVFTLNIEFKVILHKLFLIKHHMIYDLDIFFKKSK